MSSGPRKAGIIGWPVAHSLSPLLHRYWLDEYGIDGSYEKIAAEPKDFQTTIERLRGEGYSGVNVTIPHKQAAFALADDCDEGARVTEAANLLVFKDGLIHARNTDGTGLTDSLMSELGGIALGGKNIVLLGAGGAARGIADALYRQGVAKITILNRHAERARQLVQNAKVHRPDGNFLAGDFEDWQTAAPMADLVINTTSAGMKGNPPLNLDLGALPPRTVVCDIVYNPQETPLLKAARARGLRTIDGLGMLMHQAIPAFQAFYFADVAMLPKPRVTKELREKLEQALRG